MLGKWEGETEAENGCHPSVPSALEGRLAFSWAVIEAIRFNPHAMYGGQVPSVRLVFLVSAHFARGPEGSIQTVRISSLY